MSKHINDEIKAYISQEISRQVSLMYAQIMADVRILIQKNNSNGGGNGNNGNNAVAIIQPQQIAQITQQIGGQIMKVVGAKIEEVSNRITELETSGEDILHTYRGDFKKGKKNGDMYFDN